MWPRVGIFEGFFVCAHNPPIAFRVIGVRGTKHAEVCY